MEARTIAANANVVIEGVEVPPEALEQAIRERLGGEADSVVELPVSDAAVRSGVDGTVGAIVSIVTDRAADAAPAFPAMSVAVAVMLCVPSASAEVVML